jgi:hypothetical protein
MKDAANYGPCERYCGYRPVHAALTAIAESVVNQDAEGA